MTELFAQIAGDYTTRTVALGSLMLGGVAGTVGSFAFLRRESLVSDAVSHAALPGIVLAFLLGESRAPWPILAGAAVAGWIGTLLVVAVVRSTRVKKDAALAMMLSVFFGVGLVLLTFARRHAGAGQAGLDRFLFGQAAAVLEQDLWAMAAVGTAVVAGVLLPWKDWKALSFDPVFAAATGRPVRSLEVLMTGLLVVTIVLGLQAVGVVLMSALIVAPAAAARQWTDRLGRMVALSAVFGGASGTAGALISSRSTHLPTGPAIVLTATAVALVSVLFAPARGLAWSAARRWRARRRLMEDRVLVALAGLARGHDDPAHAHHQAMLEVTGLPGAHRSLHALERRGFVREGPHGHWSLTPAGATEASRLVGEPHEDAV